jgi:hypothetical protein
MLEALKQFKHETFDALYFIPADDDDTLKVELNTYKDPGKDVGGNEIGKCYHIVLWQHDEDDGSVKELDTFDAILADPLTYISQLIPCNWYGIIARTTTTSKNFIDPLLAKMREV